MEADTRTGKTSLRSFLAAVRHRRKQALLLISLGLLVTLLTALLWPPTYQSIGTILIEQQEVPQELVRSTISSYADQRVQTISQRVMTTQNLLDIIRRYDLYPKERRRYSREEIIERMRKDVVFKLISADVIDPRSGIPRQATIAFTVAYRSRSQDQAFRVANELATLYLNENLSERTRLTGEASEFLQAESTRMAKRVAELESQLADFRSKHADALPELTAVNMQVAEHSEDALREAQMRQISLEEQRAFLTAQLAQIKPNSVIVGEDGERILTPADRLKSLRTQLASAQALYSPDHPDIVRLKREIAGLEQQQGVRPATNELLRELESARGELGEAEKRYTPEHPDVQRLRKRVAALEAALSAEGAAAPESSVAATPAPDPAAIPAYAQVGPDPTSPHENADNPAYIQIRSQLNATNADLRALEQQMRELRVRIAGNRRNINVPPEVEREYRQLTRDYDTTKLKYEELRAKQIEAQVAQNLETDRKGERFTLIDPPLPPEEPWSPNRPAILILGLVLSLGLGAATIALLESNDQTVRGREDLVELLRGPPMATVPRIITQADVRAARRRRVMAIWATVLGSSAAVLLIHLFVRPLDVAWYAALRRFGL